MIEISNYQKKCKITRGGVRRFYLLPYEELSQLQIQSEGMVLTKYPETDVYLFNCLGTYSQDSQVEDGAYFFSQSCSLQLSKAYDLSGFDIHAFLQQDYKVILETNNGDNIIFGVRNGMEGTTNNSSGSDKSEFNGFNLDFSGREETSGLWIENLDDFFGVKTANVLNAGLNFKI